MKKIHPLAALAVLGLMVFTADGFLRREESLAQALVRALGGTPK